MACEKSWFKSYRPLVGLLKQPLQLNLGELTRVIHHMCVAIPQQYLHLYIYIYLFYIYILSMCTRYLTVDATSGGWTIHDYEKDRHWGHYICSVRMGTCFIEYLSKLTSHRYKSQYTKKILYENTIIFLALNVTYCKERRALRYVNM